MLVGDYKKANLESRIVKIGWKTGKQERTKNGLSVLFVVHGKNFRLMGQR
jgi:hypothetical protein